VFRFLVSRRWITFALVVILFAALCVELSRWQFHRLAERKAENAIIVHDLNAKPVRLDQLLRPRTAISARWEWRRVIATGQFDPSHQLIVRYQYRNAVPGVDVLTPLVTRTGVAILVDRGWLATNNDVNTPPKLPAPPPGEVTVTGWLHHDQAGYSSQLLPIAGGVRLIASRSLAPRMPYPLYHGYLQMLRVTPPPATKLARPLPPAINSGPHFFYALQWLFFAGLALFGIGYFAWSEAKVRRGAPPTAARAPSVSSAAK
jgi:cytochrome oxidase assembly protein ShyY1